MKKVFFAVVLTVAFIAVIYLFSPFLRLGPLLAEAVSKGNGEAAFSCEGSRLTFPLGLEMGDFRIDFRKRNNARLEADILNLRPKLAELLTGRLCLLVDAEAYGGAIDGRLEFLKYLTAQGPLKAKLSVSGVDLENCSYVSAVLGAPLKGKLKCALDFTGDSNDPLRGSGRMDFTISEGDFRASRRTTGLITDIRFNSMEAQIVFEQDKLKVGKLILASDSLHSVLKGYVFLKEDDWGASEVSLSGKLALPAFTSRQMDFAITGTVAKPIITVM